MDDADARRHDLERVERLHPPLHELVALAVALELELHVEVERVLACRSSRSSPSGRRRGRPAPAARSSSGSCPCSAATLRIAARSTSSGTPVKSCSTTRATTNGISSMRARGRAPSWRAARTCSSVTFLPSQLRSTRLEHDADGHRQARDRADARRLERGQRIELAGGAGGEPEFAQGAEGIVFHWAALKSGFDCGAGARCPAARGCTLDRRNHP